MEGSYKAIKKIMDIIKISGFYITSKGDESVGIFDARWELRHDFYFDNQQELEDFRAKLKAIYEDYCGQVTVETFEEYQKLVEDEERAQYQLHPVRYLIKSKEYSDSYKKANSVASYSSNVSEGIHFEHPH